MREKTYLKEALNIEEQTLLSVEECHRFYQKAGSAEMARIMLEMAEDEKKHIAKIKEHLNRLEK